MGLVKKSTTKDRKIAIEWLGLEGFDKFMSKNRNFKAQKSMSSSFQSESSAFKVISLAKKTQSNFDGSLGWLKQMSEMDEGFTNSLFSNI